MGGYREVERKVGRMQRRRKEGWEDIGNWKGRMGQYREVKGRMGQYREMERKDWRI